MSGTTIYGSTAVCSPVGKFTTCLDLGGALTGTSATFSGLVTINTNTRGLALNRDAVTNYNGIGYQTAGVQKWFVGMRENLSSNNYIIYSEVGTDILTLNQSTGAATFSFIGSGYGITSKATSNYNGILTDTSTNTGGGYFAAAKNGTRYSIFGTTGAWVGDTSTDTAIVSEAASSNIRFYTNGSATESMRITSAGAVGINCTSPSATLHLNGCFKQQSSNFGIAQFTQTFTAGTPTCFSYGSYNQGMNDNIAGLLVITINEPTSCISVNNAVWTGLVTNPRGTGTYIAGIYSHYGSCAGSNISYLNVVNAASNTFAITACSASGAITLRANVTFIGGGGIS
jgi:hypothetical protein